MKADLEIFNTRIEVLELCRKPSRDQELIGDIIQELVLQLGSEFSLIDKVEIEADLKERSLEEILRRDNPVLAELFGKNTFFDSKAIEQDSRVFEAYYSAKEEEEKKRQIIYYYIEPRPIQKRVDYYIFTPDWATILRVPEAELGPGVLGVAYIGLNLIKILNTLYGDDFVEVKKHELLHLRYPQKSEWEIRQQTKQELGYATKYQ